MQASKSAMPIRRIMRTPWADAAILPLLSVMIAAVRSLLTKEVRSRMK
jgi:hypothetical protein